MVARKNVQKKVVKRKYAKKNKSVFKPIMAIARLPFPRVLKRTLRYMSEGVVLDPSVGGIAGDYVFSANGLFDPNISGTGHQPMGFDNIMAMYNTYHVLGSKISCTFTNNDTTYAQFVGISLKKDTTAIAAAQIEIEQGETVYRQITPVGGSNSTVTLSRGFSTKKHTGNKAVLGEDTLGGSSAGNPSAQYYFHVWADPNNGVNTGSVVAHVIIDYIAVFSDLKAISQS
jgi:hypothetical protein